MLYKVLARIWDSNHKQHRFESEAFKLQPNGDYSLMNLFKYFTIEQQSEIEQIHSRCKYLTIFEIMLTSNFIIVKDGITYAQDYDGSLKTCEQMNESIAEQLKSHAQDTLEISNVNE